ncbi:multiple sugar transport system permease protein [Arthrobacter sp. V4I6]|uniref:carbohydrate ABC transporter permease n=1 Tax=unclassified Arthrobacter TaxID=235627 RepID=UPI00277E335F|nr:MULTISPECIES: sugar ABC transporter permease [unclassified Arthrobacter]MDQ0819348.1 multiple sugar transport system permease protein [Arthrobacter sp. V1I7]MDQ0853532.1 multiple sugar transport system permease protein [Arthrobacter sp. V4I6]
MLNWISKNMKWTFTAPALVLTALLLVFPLIYTTWMSLHKWSGSSVKAPLWLGAGNYINLFTNDPRFVDAVGRTLLFTGVTVAAEVTLGFGIALILRKSFRGERIVRTIILLPLVATPVAISMAWLLLLEPTIGLGNQVLGAFGIPEQEFLGSASGALWLLMMIDVWQWTPMIVLIALAGLTSLPDDPYQAAVVDGASSWQQFKYLTLPLMVPTLFAGLLLRLVDSLKTFDIIYVTTKGGPGNATETLNTYGFMQAFEYTNFGRASAVLIIFFAIVLAVTLVVSKVRSKVGDLS